MTEERRSGQDRRASALGGRRASDHGTRVAYQWHGCRCPACVQAEAAYHAQRAKGQIAGWVSSAPARAHLARLQHARVGLRQVARLSGVSRATLTAIRRGQPQIHPDTERRILALTRPALADGQTVTSADSYATRERLRRLAEEGYALRDRFTRRVCSLAAPSPTKNARPVRVSTWKRVTAVYQRLLFEDTGGLTC